MRTALPLLAVLALGFACNKVVDEDHDGFAEEYDCDDSDAATHAGAAELCDGIDNDCDGEIDEDAVDGLAWFPDLDGDGFGVFGENLVSCEAPEGYVSNAEDCDDADAAVHPDATEVCDFVDNDCSGLVDDDTTDGTTFYADWDGDGFGSESVFGTYCAQPEGYVLTGGDCDDFEVLSNPDQREICDTLDNDCDGTIDEPEEAYGATTFWMDADSDGYGDAEASTFVCFMPDGYTDNDMDCDDTTADKSPGLEEICNDGIDNDCSGDSPECGFHGGYKTTSAADYTFTGTTSDNFGENVDLGDLDGDGKEDILVGGPYYNSGSSTSSDGAVFVWYGEPSDDADDFDADAYFLGDGDDGSSSNYLSNSIVVLGDVDGDGYEDLLMGGYYTNSSRGSAYLLYGGSSRYSGEYMVVDEADATFNGLDASDYLGYAAGAAGDHNGDGYADLMIGADGADYGGTTSGQVMLFFGSTDRLSGDYDEEDADAVWSGDASSDYMGDYESMHANGDLDGDGYDDLMLGAYGWGSDGGVMIEYGSSSPTTGYMSFSDASATIAGETAGSLFGRQVRAGDMDGDGYTDLLAADYSTIETIYVFRGGATQMSGEYDAGDAYATFTQGSITWGSSSSTYFGKAFDVGDVNGDGYMDLAGSEYYASAVFVFLGPFSEDDYTTDDADGVVQDPGASSSLYFGHEDGVELGDVNGDGYEDLLVGADGSEKAYLWLGGGM